MGALRRSALVSLCVAGATLGCTRGHDASPAPPSSAASPAPSSGSRATPPQAPADRKARLAAMVPKLDAYLADYLAKKKAPGVAVGLVVDGDLAWAKGYGVRNLVAGGAVDADSVFNIDSITKPFTAMAILRLRDESKLSLDVPASTYLPELDLVVPPTDDAPKITVRHLLTHTSGLQNTGPLDPNRPPPTEAEVLRALRGLRLRSPPGLVMSYSSQGLALLGIVVARVSGKPYRRYMQEEILGPLGMSASGWDEAVIPRDRLASPHTRKLDGSVAPAKDWPIGALEGAGNLYTSVRDMARFVSYQLDAWPPRSGAESGPLRRSSRREMQQMQAFDHVRLSPESNPPLSIAHGVGFGEGSHYVCGVGPVFTMSGGGGGYASWINGFPEEGVGVVVLVNEWDPNGNVFEGLRWMEVAEILRASGVLEPRPPPPPSPDLVVVRERLTKLLFDRFDDTEASRLFGTPLEPSAPPDWIRRELRAIHDQEGSCAFGRDLAPRHAMEARWLMTCARGEVELTAQVATIDPLILDGQGWGFEIARYYPPSDALAHAAERLVALLGTWDDAAFETLAAPSVDRKKTAVRFTDLAALRSACTLGRGRTDDEDRSHARYDIACDRGPLQLDVTVDGDGHRVSRIDLRPADDPRCTR